MRGTKTAQVELKVNECEPLPTPSGENALGMKFIPALLTSMWSLGRLAQTASANCLTLSFESRHQGHAETTN
jgi:hypothetical protein